MIAGGPGRFLCGLGLVLAAAGIPGRAAAPLTIATYNVENYLATGRRVDGGYRRAWPKPEAAKRALRAVIRALDADVLALQEMGPEPYLEELRRDLRAEGLDYPYMALGEAADQERHTAVLSRRPFSRVQSHAGLDFRYRGRREPVKRGLLEIGIPDAGGELTLFVVHLKSRLTDRKDDAGAVERRLGEAVAIRDLVLTRFPDPSRARFLVVGDFNDAPDGRALRRLCRRGHTRIAFKLPAADPRGDTWTYAYRRAGSYLRLDFILVSPGLRPAVPGGAATVYDGPGVREASDHRPVVVRLNAQADG